jgi:hypothetical protein
VVLVISSSRHIQGRHIQVAELVRLYCCVQGCGAGLTLSSQAL